MEELMLEREDILDNDLLSKLDLMDYDIDRTFYRVCKFMKKYRRLKSKHYDEVPIKITTKYKYIYVEEKTKGIDDYTKLDNYIDEDTEYHELSKRICLVTQTFSQEELVYYTVCLYQQKSETRAFKEIGCSNYGLLPIKRSCIVKFANAFDIEVYKKEGFNDDEEEAEYQEYLEAIKM